MHQAYLEAVQRMARGQQLETAEVRGQDQRALAGISRRELVPYVEPIVGDAPREAAVKETAEPNVLGAGSSEVDVGRAQDALALGGAFFGERDLEIADSDSPVTVVEAMEDQPTRDAQL